MAYTQQNFARTLIAAVASMAFASLSAASTVSVILKNAKDDPLAAQQTVVALSPVAGRAEQSGAPIRHDIEQVNSQFQPFISVVQRGAEVVFPNRDTIAHHVYSFSEAAQFQSELYSNQQSHAISANTTGIISVGCNIHDWMLAYLYVVDTPYFGFATDSKIQFEDVEAGDYQLSYWHPGLSVPVEQLVTVRADNIENFSLSVDLRAISQPPSRNASFLEDDDY